MGIKKPSNKQIEAVEKIIDLGIEKGTDGELAILYDKIADEMEKRGLFDEDAKPSDIREKKENE